MARINQLLNIRCTNRRESLNADIFTGRSLLSLQDVQSVSCNETVPIPRCFVSHVMQQLITYPASRDTLTSQDPTEREIDPKRAGLTALVAQLLLQALVYGSCVWG